MAQKLKPNRLDNRGGYRENAGRPALGNVVYSRRISPELIEKMDLYLDLLKLNKI